MTRRATRRRTSAASARPRRDRLLDGALNAERRHLLDEVPGTARGTLQLLLVALVADQVLEVFAAVQAPVFVDRHDCVTAFRLPAPPGFRLPFTPPLRRSSTVFCRMNDSAELAKRACRRLSACEKSHPDGETYGPTGCDGVSWVVRGKMILISSNDAAQSVGRELFTRGPTHITQETNHEHRVRRPTCRAPR